MTPAAEIWLALGYASFLLAASSALRRLARRTERGLGVSAFGRREEGRPLHERDVSWPHSEAARFERGLATVLDVLAAFLLAVVAARHRAFSLAWVAALFLPALVATRRGLVPRLGQVLRRDRDAGPTFRR